MRPLTLNEAQEGFQTLGLWMGTRYNRFAEDPIQKWDMPPREKDFFTVYAMNLVLESDGFDSLAAQEPEDVQAFIRLLDKLGAANTSAFVRNTLATLKSKTPDEKDKCASNYYKVFERDEVWLKLVDLIDIPTYTRYSLKAQAIEAAAGDIFDPAEWQGELPEAQ